MKCEEGEEAKGAGQSIFDRLCLKVVYVLWAHQIFQVISSVGYSSGSLRSLHWGSIYLYLPDKGPQL